MEMKELSSGGIFAIGWENGIARVTFRKKDGGPGKTCEYGYASNDVPEEVVTAIASAGSPYTEFSGSLKYGYDYRYV